MVPFEEVIGLDHIKYRTSMYIGDNDPDKLQAFLSGILFGRYPINCGLSEAYKARGDINVSCAGIIYDLRKKDLSDTEINHELVEIHREAFRIQEKKLS